MCTARVQSEQQQSQPERQPEQMPEQKPRTREVFCPACCQLDSDSSTKIGSAPANIERHCRQKKHATEVHHMALLEETLNASNRRGPLLTPRAKKPRMEAKARN